MLGAKRAAELATSLLHIGGLSGAASYMTHGDMSGAVGIAVVASLCADSHWGGSPG